jgi:hypothetical protein
MVMGAMVNGQSSHTYRLDKGQFNAEHKTLVRFLVLQTYYCYVLKNLFNTDYILNYARYNLQFCTVATIVNADLQTIFHT